jgi:hypothetical protein
MKKLFFKGGLLSFFVLLFVLLFNLIPALASDFFLIETIASIRSKDLTFESADKSASFTVKAGTALEQSYVRFLRLMPLERIADRYRYELNGLIPAGDLYYLELKFLNRAGITNDSLVTINYQAEGKLKSVFYWDDIKKEFIKIEANRNNRTGQLSFVPPEVDYIVFGLFEEPVQTGKASWYVHPRFPTELMAASVDFPFGTKVKVINLSNGKEVIVTIKDYGPDKSVHPDRVIDLGKEAFAAIASVRAGVIDVSVEPYIENN